MQGGKSEASKVQRKYVDYSLVPGIEFIETYLFWDWIKMLENMRKATYNINKEYVQPWFGSG